MADGGPKTVSYTYDADGNRQTLGYPSGGSATITYSSRNQVATITSSGITASYVYDKAGNRTSKTLGNATSAVYIYDSTNRLQSVDNQKNGVSFGKYDYGYNNVNDRTSRTETINGMPKVDNYGYDGVDQLTQVKYNYNSGANTQDRLVGYNYDAAGNRSGSNGVTDSVNGNSNYTVNNLNQYTTAGSLTPVYDGNGNMGGQDGWTYTYDALNRVTSAYNSSMSMTIAFAYDPRNRCVSRTVNGTITFFYYDRWNLLEEQNASSALIGWYVQGPKVDDLVARVVGSTTSYYHQDALGSTVALTDSSSNTTERYVYDIFGSPIFKDGSSNAVSGSASGNRFLFTGREYLQQAEVYDYRNRIYSAALGRFLQADSTRFAGDGINMYRYCRNNVTTAVDPFGLKTVYLYQVCNYTYDVTKSDSSKACKCPKTVFGNGTVIGDVENRGEAEQDAYNDAKGKLPRGCQITGDPKGECHTERSTDPVA